MNTPQPYFLWLPPDCHGREAIAVARAMVSELQAMESAAAAPPVFPVLHRYTDSSVKLHLCGLN